MLKEDNKIKANQNTKVFIWWIYSKGCNGTLSAINPPNKYFCYNLSLFPKYWGNFLDTIANLMQFSGGVVIFSMTENIIYENPYKGVNICI